MSAPARPPDVEITMPGYRPPSLNVYMRAHWSKRKAMMIEALLSISYARANWSPSSYQAEHRRLVEIEITLSGRDREYDPDNTKKVILDACVKDGLLRDDSAKWCESFVTFKRGPKRQTVLRFWNVEAELRGKGAR